MLEALDSVYRRLGAWYIHALALMTVIAALALALIPASGAALWFDLSPRELLLASGLVALASLCAALVGLVTMYRLAAPIQRWLRTGRGDEAEAALTAAWRLPGPAIRSALVAGLLLVPVITWLVSQYILEALYGQVFLALLVGVALSVWATTLGWFVSDAAWMPVRRDLERALPDQPRPVRSIISLDDLAESLYRRAGDRYLLVLVAAVCLVTLSFAPLAAAVVALYEPTTPVQFTLTMLISAGVVLTGVTNGLRATHKVAAPLVSWIATGRPGTASADMWEAALRLPVAFSMNAIAGSLAVTPIGIALLTLLYDFSPGEVAVGLFGVLIMGAWTSLVVVFVGQLLVGPIVREIASGLPSDFRIAKPGRPIGAQLVGAVTATAVIAGGLTAVLATRNSTIAEVGSIAILAVVLVAPLIVVLALLVIRVVDSPVKRLADATKQVAGGNLSVVVPIVSDDDLGQLTSSFNEMVRGLAERERLRDALGAYVHPEVARRIIEEGNLLSGDEVEVTVLFADIRDFTSFSESVEPAVAVARLNEFFDVATSVIEEHRGHVNRYIGDGLLAVFGTPTPLDDHADQALEAACELAEATERVFRGELRIGIGINTGSVLAGSVGGGGHVEFTVIGDTVNVAARVEQHTKATGDRVLLTDATRDALTDLGGLIEPRGEVPLKGKAQPIAIHAPASGSAARGA